MALVYGAGFGKVVHHLRNTPENGRHVLPGLSHLEELRWWGRDRLRAAPVGPGSDSAPASNGNGRLPDHRAAQPSSPLVLVEVAKPTPDVRYLIVDDCKLSRENLATIFGAHERAVAWDLPSLCNALEIAPQIVLLNMGTRDNRTLLRVVRQTCPDAKVIVVGLSEDDESEIVACAEAGVAGYHLRAESLDDLLTLVSKVANGESICSPRVSAILLRRLSALAAQRRPEVKELVLTAREIQILRMLESGLSNQEIADHLYIAVHTVKNHVHSILSKLGVSTRAEAAAYSRSVN
jgi:DNA-binding NarL/FixJ family response regulator